MGRFCLQEIQHNGVTHTWSDFHPYVTCKHNNLVAQPFHTGSVIFPQNFGEKIWEENEMDQKYFLPKNFGKKTSSRASTCQN